jgi:tetratricopeptide (TPR) repeat protein
VSPEDQAAPRPGTVAARRAAAEAGAGRGPSAPPSRGRRRTAPAVETKKARPAPAATGAVALADGERDESTTFLLQSLRDLEREHDAGDLSDEDYVALRDDYTARAAAALRAEQRGKAPPLPLKPGRSPLQWAAIIAGIVGFAVLAGILVAQASGERSSGESATGAIDQTPTQAAGECINLTAEQQQSGDVATQDVLRCYQKVLEDDPDNPVARTYLGWTLFITARQAEDSLGQDELVELYVQARRQIDLAVQADPGYADARAFLVVLAAAEGRYEVAAEQLAAFDDLDAPADMAALVEPLRQEIADNLANPTTTTTTTPPG